MELTLPFSLLIAFQKSLQEGLRPAKNLFLDALGATVWMSRDTTEKMPLWSDVLIGGIVSHILTKSGDVVSIRSIVVAHKEVSRVWPLGIIVSA